MTRIKLCGMMRQCDIEYANELMPEYVGFVFARSSRRCVSFDTARELSARLDPGIIPVGVFVNEEVRNIKEMIDHGIIRMVQLHGGEDDGYLKSLRRAVSCPVIQAFRIRTAEDIAAAERSAADYIMLDSGGGTGRGFDHSLIGDISREFFLAGGLDAGNVAETIKRYKPFAVDASSALETDGAKDKDKMRAFVMSVRKENN